MPWCVLGVDIYGTQHPWGLSQFKAYLGLLAWLAVPLWTVCQLVQCGLVCLNVVLKVGVMCAALSIGFAYETEYEHVSVFTITGSNLTRITGLAVFYHGLI